jgi:hypothetical protein
MLIDIQRPPYIKGKNFCFNPVVKYGIPDYADTLLNPKVKGTAKWQQYWEEQLYYIHNGYQTGGFFLPGRYYYYLNFNNMSTIRSVISPDMCDLHLELSYLVEWAKKNNKNIIIAKKRRAGISEFTHKAIIDYGWRFMPGYRAGVAAGKSTFADELINKWKVSEAMLPSEFSLKKLNKNSDVIISGYKTQNTLGESIEKGTKNQIYIETMFSDGELFKGTYLNDVIAEEAGQFEKLEDFYSATKACLKDGEEQVGTMFFYGTGGEMDKGSKGFKKMWDEAEQHNFIKFLIDAPRFHRPCYGGATKNGAVYERVPNLIKQYKPFQLIGVEDLEEAKASILKEREQEKKSGDIVKYNKHLQDYPFTEQEIFRKTVVNAFDEDVLNEQGDKIASENKKYLRCQLEWVKNPKTGEIAHPLKTYIKLLNNSDDADTPCILIHQDHMNPLLYHEALYCAGIDSYDQHLSKTSKSKGAMCVLIRPNSLLKGGMERAPVATICCRPKRKEIFYEMCLKLAVFYNLKESVLIDVRTPAIIEYWRERGCEKYIAFRPRKLEKEDSEQTSEYGFSLNIHSKPIMVGIMQTAILDYGKHIWFPELIEQLCNFDQVAIGSDNDLADAYGLALIQDVTYDLRPRDVTKVAAKDPFKVTSWGMDADGDIVPMEKQDAGKTGLFSIERDDGKRFV